MTHYIRNLDVMNTYQRKCINLHVIYRVSKCHTNNQKVGEHISQKHSAFNCFVVKSGSLKQAWGKYKYLTETRECP